MTSTNLGRSNFLRDKQQEKASLWISFSRQPGSKLTVINDLQSLKQPFPMNSTEAGTIIRFREEQKENASFPIRKRREPRPTEKLDNLEHS
jgi:hypothetical protein